MYRSSPKTPSLEFDDDYTGERRQHQENLKTARQIGKLLKNNKFPKGSLGDAMQKRLKARQAKFKKAYATLNPIERRIYEKAMQI